MMNTSGAVRPSALADWLLARGRSGVTTAQAAELMGIPEDHVRVRLRSRGAEFVSPARGLWIAVPPEYRLWGAPEGIEIVDRTMRHLGVEYYVGWLTAAAIHGAAHHAPQTFQVATSRRVADRVVGRTDFRFQVRRDVGELPTIAHPTRSGSARVSSREVTALDLASDIVLASGIDNAATVILSLADEGLDLPAMADVSARLPAAAVRRVGWIIENLGGLDGAALRPAAVGRGTTPSLLHPRGPRRGPTDRRWLIQVNTEIEADV